MVEKPKVLQKRVKQQPCLSHSRLQYKYIVVVLPFFRDMAALYSFFNPIGHTAMQIPHIRLSRFNFCLANSPHFSLHLCASKKLSRCFVISQSAPLAAFAGHLSMQIVQWPHLLLSIGFAVFSGFLFIRILVNLNPGPNFVDINKSVLPIHPSPALVATILWDISTVNVFK